MSTSESALHLELKRLALIWAQAHQFPVAACEVSLPNLRFRIDVGAYRPGVRRELQKDARSKKPRMSSVSALGTVAVFEAKASRADFLRDSRRTERVIERMRALTATRLELEAALKLNCPSLRNGDALFPEYESYSLEKADHAPYAKVVRELKMLSGQLHSQTKLDDLVRWKAAHLHYLVIEPGVLAAHELPLGWGLLIRDGSRLQLAALPERHEIEESAGLTFLHRLAIAGTKATNREQAIGYEFIDAERRGMTPQEIAARQARVQGCPP